MSSEELHPSLAERGESDLLAVALLGRPRWLPAILRLLLAAGATLFLGALGFGDLGSGWSVQGGGFGLLVGGVLAWGLVPFLAAVRLSRLHRRVEWSPGLYLFEAGVVDGLRPERPRIALAGLSRIRVIRYDVAAPPGRGSLELSFEGGARASLPVPEGPAAERLGERVRALAGREPQWTSDGRSLPPVRSLRPLLVGVLLGILLGAGLWALRDRVSDDQAFSSAQAKDSSGGWSLYLSEVGGRHSARVSSELLPLAALAEARSENSVPSLLRWREEYPQEVGQAACQSAIDGLYSRARERLEGLEPLPEGSRQASDRLALVRLLDLQEAAGSPPLPLRFEPGATRWLEQLDATVGDSFDGRPLAAATPRYQGIPLVRRRLYVARALEEGMQLLLGVRVLYFHPGEGPVPDDEPGVWARSAVEPGTSVFEAEGRPEVFVELMLALDVEVSVPGGEDIELEFFLGSPDTFVAPDSPERAEQPAELIYEAMFQRVVDGLASEVVRIFGG